jgi:hypothetical protein
MPSAKAEVEALWEAVFGGPPPIEAEHSLLLDVLMRCLPPPPPYGDPVTAREPPTTDS